MSNNIYIWIDESGTLSKNPKNPQFYLYAGFWCLESDKERIESTFGRNLINFFPSCKNGEKKASAMKNRKKMLLIRSILADNCETFHPIFVVEDIEKVNAELVNNEAIQLHKNYLLRRFVEKCILDYRSFYSEKADSVYVNIDDQSRTQLYGADPFPTYINRYFNNMYPSGTFVQSQANFLVSYKDSAKYRGIQICDVLANCKYNHYVHGRNDLHRVPLKNQTPVVKLP